MNPYQSSDWRHLAEQASTEQDPKKLTDLVNDLNRVLAKREAIFEKVSMKSDTLT
jgi:hypothetical protein